MFCDIIHWKNATRCGKLLYSEMNTSNKSYEVKMSSTWEQSAWIYNFINPSETKRSTFYFVNNFNNSTKSIILDKNFCQWFVGIVDGDGCFHFSKNEKDVWNFTFKISQSSYNLRLLYYIKSKVGVGTVSITNSKDNCAEYRIRNINHIIENILPIFDNYSLLTNKYYSYIKFKESIKIYASDIPKKEKLSKIDSIKNSPIDEKSISLAWNIINYNVDNPENVSKVISKNWLVGFTEAEGSFYIKNKSNNNIVHSFEITQKNDAIVMKAISKILPISFKNKKTYYTVVTSNKDSIKFIIDYFFKTIKGMKSLEYRIWARSFIKKYNSKKNNKYEYIKYIQNIMHNIRSIRFDKNFKKISK